MPNSSFLICLLLPFVLRKHVVITLDHAVIELALFIGPLAEIMLEFRLGGDDILFPAVGVADVLAEGGLEPLGALLFHHPLAVGRVADDDAGLGGQVHFSGIAVTEGDAVCHAGLPGIGNGEGDALGVIVGA